VLFLGEFEHSIDPKGRLAIPAEVRSALDSSTHGEALIAAPGPNGCLWLWPEKTFEQLAAALGGSLVGDEDLMAFERLVFSKASRMQIDGAGRVRVPQRLLTEFSIETEVMVLGVRDHLELMPPTRWRQEQDRLQPQQQEVWRRARVAMAASRSGTDS